MKTNLCSLRRCLGAGITALLLQTSPASAATFTSDATIGVTDTSYEGADIIITNCRVTVDGPHAFNTVRVRNGGTLTHTQIPGGDFQFSNSITGEAHVLTSTNTVVLNQSNVVATTVVVRDQTGTVTYTNTVDYLVSQTASSTFIDFVPGSAIPDGATILVGYGILTTVPAGLNLTVTGGMFIDPGGAINANAAGYSAGFGPGPGSSQGSPASGSGAGHGGYGGYGASNSFSGLTYDSILQPAAKGSSGGSGTGGTGGNGGGAIKLAVGGALQISGSISANGADATNSRAGGGSGGGIWLSAQTITGAGSISADGGAGEPTRGGGGGGGRIAIYAATNLFSGNLLARGGVGFVTGGAGTLYTRNTSQPAGQLLVDNGGRVGTNTLLLDAEPFDLTIRGQARVAPAGSPTVGNLFIATNGFLVSPLDPQPLILNAAGSATIQAGGGILADGNGLHGGPGAGSTTNVDGVYFIVGAGGGYGGSGGSGGIGPAGGLTYGLLNTPTDRGSGGGAGSGLVSFNAGGSGGGAIRITIGGALILDGKISANGNASVIPNAGAGSGGSVWLTTGPLSGSGVISANGGSALGLGGGGGGGRIAISYTSNAFSGIVSAYGGGGASWGGAGTIYKSQNFASGSVPDGVVVDNGGRSGGVTTLGSFSSFTSSLVVAGGALLSWPLKNDFTMVNLFIASNSVLFLTSAQAGPILVLSNATIQAGGWIKGDGDGLFQAPSGNGGALTSSTFGPTGGGGGHGGYGTPSLAGALGGFSFDNATQPTGRGGNGAPVVTSGPPQGGTGGAAIRLNVTGTLLLDGKLSVDGHDGNSLHSGGGAGGSIWLTVGTLAGAGTLSANGGRGNGVGGSGGGGRMAFYFASNSFAGTITARGGSNGASFGGAGTIYSRTNSQSVGQFTVDNGGSPGALTTLVPAGADLMLAGGAIVVDPDDSAVSIRNLLINSNALLFVTNRNFSLAVSGNATILAGGGITANGAGSPGGQGQGPGRTVSAQSGISGSGAGHGGTGANSSGGAPGGITYDSITDPNLAGSGGGGGDAGTAASGAGFGGGLIRLTVNGNLQVDGSISANGTASTNSNNSGGGSGGSIRLSAAKFSGAGRISVNGGAGLGSGGGGGGGRMAIYYGSNTFSGVLSAFGAAGFGFGGAGTIYLQSNGQLPGAQLILDNGGPLGAVTTLLTYQPTFGPSDLTVRNGAILSLNGSQLSLRNLLIGSNAFLTIMNLNSPISSSSATIQAGGGIIADGTGSAGGQGQGAGRTVGSQSANAFGSGAGHGGSGANSSAGSVGGISYDSIGNPTQPGSGGGAGSGTGTNALGGSGGGILRLIVTGGLQMDGSISANGKAGVGLNSGGGSGGSIWLTVGTLVGSGRITANGGAANGSGGGGGGGGRIAINYATNTFSGVISAFGGGGFGFGGAGTIYLQPNIPFFPFGDVKLPLVAQLFLDNGGPLGAPSPLPAVGPSVDVNVKGGAVATANTPSFVIRDLLVASNSWLIVSNQSQLTVNGNAMIQVGAVLDAEGTINGGGQGQGGTLFSTFYGFTGGGGGHGGFGSSSLDGAIGGTSFDSPTQPTGRGGNGATISPGIAQGGVGGGALHLAVTGTLLLDGRFTADGHAANAGNYGGGAGGSFWLSVGTLSGAGTISANGGAGSGVGGGGGGGRLALYFQTNNFAGAMLAHGASAIAGAGGAGTIYIRNNSQSIGQLLVDNGGLFGADTPVANIGIFDLTVSGGAAVYPTSSFLILSNLFVNGGGLVTSGSSQTNLELTVLSNVVVGIGADIAVDGLGFAPASGPGAGQGLSGFGSGGGYGGSGGASWTAPGGSDYGSATQPVDFGSGGGFGSGPVYTGGSLGGGAIRLNIGGTLTMDGSLSAHGSPGLQDGSGGGSGGSIWVTTRTMRGNGQITADGGEGELFGGGGGAGGRIAIYYLTNPGHTNNFTGTISAFGALGENYGDDGSVFVSAGLPALRGISYTPTGIVSNAVSNVDVVFNAAINSFSASPADVVLTTPNGPVLASDLAVSVLSPYSLRISFPPQTAVGNYTFNLGPQIEDLYARPMAQVFTGAFTVLLPVIQGTITGTNGQPMPGVAVQQSGAYSLAMTDANGHYALGFVPGSSFTVTPLFNNLMSAPGSRTYANITDSMSNQDYLIVTTIAPALTGGLQDTNLVASWYSLAGVTYQLYASTNLVDWLPYGSPISGSNAVIQVPLPIGGDPMKFFRVQANN